VPGRAASSRAAGSSGSSPIAPTAAAGARSFATRARSAAGTASSAGIDDGQHIRISGQGDAGEAGGPRGDLYAEVHVAQHPFFERHGRDLLCQVPISFTQAALGAEVEVPTLEGAENMTLPRATQSGDLARLRGRGLPDIQGYGRGDLLVQLVVEVPKKLTSRQEELLREFASSQRKGVLPQRESFLEKLAKYLKQDKAEGKKP
jgi:molecular chaperone DnaJ